jgi:NCAIR mutase (PurE)-related protein
LRETLEKLAQGKISVDDAEKALRMNAIENVANVAKLDIGREKRRSVPEIIFAEGKSNEDLLAICKTMLEKNGRVIATRLNEQQNDDLQIKLKAYHIQVFPHAKSMVVRKKDYQGPQTGGRVGVLTAGTVDLAVAEEAVMIAQEMGCKTF